MLFVQRLGVSFELLTQARYYLEVCLLFFELHVYLDSALAAAALLLAFNVFDPQHPHPWVASYDSYDSPILISLSYSSLIFSHFPFPFSSSFQIPHQTRSLLRLMRRPPQLPSLNIGSFSSHSLLPILRTPFFQ